MAWTPTPSATQTWFAEDMGRKKRVNSGALGFGESRGFMAQRPYEPIMDSLEVDDEPAPDAQQSSTVSQDPSWESGPRDTYFQGDATSLYAHSHFTSAPKDRGFPRPSDDGATINSNRSIAPFDVEYVWENGRRYCGSYFMPNDELEQTRLLLVHEVYKSAFDNEPTSVPLENPRMILDVGAGTGEWAIDVADRYPDCEVTGTDIADIFPKFVAPNLFWEIDDAEREWLRAPDSYDLVHLRHMSGAFADWPFVYQQAFKVCKPGGWIEILDYDDLWSSGNFFDFFPPDSDVHRAALDWKEAAIESRYLIGAEHLQPRFLSDVGFVDVVLAEKAIPCSPKKLSTGHLFLKSLLEGIEAHSLRLLTKYKGYTAEEARAAAAKFAEAWQGIALKGEVAKDLVVKFMVLTGRKPIVSEGPEPGFPVTADATAVDTEGHTDQGSDTSILMRQSQPGDDTAELTGSALFQDPSANKSNQTLVLKSADSTTIPVADGPGAQARGEIPNMDEMLAEPLEASQTDRRL